MLFYIIQIQLLLLLFPKTAAHQIKKLFLSILIIFTIRIIFLICEFFFLYLQTLFSKKLFVLENRISQSFLKYRLHESGYALIIGLIIIIFCGVREIWRKKYLIILFIFGTTYTIWVLFMIFFSFFVQFLVVFEIFYVFL